MNIADSGKHVVGRILARRKELGMSARMLAEAVSAQGIPMNRSTLANIEVGRRADITTAELVAFARALKMTPIELLEAPPCSHCHDSPPSGYKCLSCGLSTLQ